MYYDGLQQPKNYPIRAARYRRQMIMAKVDHHLDLTSWMVLSSLSNIVLHNWARRCAAWLDFKYRVITALANAVAFFTQGPSKAMPIVVSSRYLQQPMCAQNTRSWRMRLAFTIEGSKSVVHVTSQAIRSWHVTMPSISSARSSLLVEPWDSAQLSERTTSYHPVVMNATVSDR